MGWKRRVEYGAFGDISQPVILAMSAGTMREEKEKALASGNGWLFTKTFGAECIEASDQLNRHVEWVND